MTAPATTTVRVSVQTRQKLHDLVRSSGLSTQEVLERALELYRRQQILTAANAAYARLAEDRPAWAADEAERAVWDVTLSDGLPED
jgi:mRNA interferase MazF